MRYFLFLTIVFLLALIPVSLYATDGWIKVKSVTATTITVEGYVDGPAYIGCTIVEVAEKDRDKHLNYKRVRGGDFTKTFSYDTLGKNMKFTVALWERRSGHCGCCCNHGHRYNLEGEIARAKGTYKEGS